jgi:hypothetical protein
MSLPYNGTEGYVDSPASKERAVREAKDGSAVSRQQLILHLVEVAGIHGRTWKELQGVLPDLHHGQISASLSVLHKSGDLFQLKPKRGKSHPYVHHSFHYQWHESLRIDAPARIKRNVDRDRVAKAREEALDLQEMLLLLEDGVFKPSTLFFQNLHGTISTLIELLEEKDAE